MKDDWQENRLAETAGFPTGRVHLHQDDAPVSLALLMSIIGARDDAAFELTEYGAYVNWDEIGSKMSTTEKAVIPIVRGLAIIEAHGGGVPPGLRQAVIDAVQAVV